MINTDLRAYQIIPNVSPQPPKNLPIIPVRTCNVIIGFLTELGIFDMLQTKKKLVKIHKNYIYSSASSFIFFLSLNLASLVYLISEFNLLVLGAVLVQSLLTWILGRQTYQNIKDYKEYKKEYEVIIEALNQTPEGKILLTKLK